MAGREIKHTIFETEWFSVEEGFYADEMLAGKPYYTIHAPDGVIVLAITEQGEILVIRQYRPALNKWTLELPSGGIDDGETPEQAAARELYEETGYRAGEVDLLIDGFIFLNRSDARTYAFYARRVVKDAAFQAKENINVIPLSPVEYKRMLLDGEIDQFSSLALLSLADWKFGTHFIH